MLIYCRFASPKIFDTFSFPETKIVHCGKEKILTPVVFRGDFLTNTGVGLYSTLCSISKDLPVYESV